MSHYHYLLVNELMPMGGSKLLAMQYIADNTDRETGRAEIDPDQIARFLRMNKRSASRLLDELIAAEFLAELDGKKPPRTAEMKAVGFEAEVRVWSTATSRTLKINTAKLLEPGAGHDNEADDDQPAT